MDRNPENLYDCIAIVGSSTNAPPHWPYYLELCILLLMKHKAEGSNPCLNYDDYDLKWPKMIQVQKF